MASQPQQRNHQQRYSNSSSHNSNSTLEHINAPYNFVPLSETVVTPEWGDKVSQDLPFRDGISGELELTITAQTDILVGGAQNNGHVHFFQTPDGTYAIPGSSLRGMFRNVMEIATFSRMSAVDEKSYSLRDISKAGNVYQSRVAGKVKTGFLKREKNKIVIIPCDMARLDHRDLEHWKNQSKPVFNKTAHKRVADKYDHWRSIFNLKQNNNLWINCSINQNVKTGFGTENQVRALGSGSIKAFPVLTGQISDCTQGETEADKAKKKHKDFVFFNLKSEKTIDINAYDPNAWKDFLFIHHDAEKSTDTDMSWPNHWRGEFRAGRDVPVFYLQSDSEAETGRLQIGLAYLPKLAGDFSIYDMIRNTSNQHLQEQGFDFTTLVFGRVGKEPKDALKGRVYFEPAIAQGTVSPEQNPPATILNGAKPSYFPNYLKQATNSEGTTLAPDKQYATYLRTNENQAPKIRGWKRYPARPEYNPEPIAANNDNTAVQTHLHVLPKHTQFTSRVVFHNLKPVELGALLWSIHMEGHRHGLGMGKSFGAGQVTVDIGWDIQKLVCNDSKNSIKGQDDYLTAFKQYMKDQWIQKDWGSTLQIMSLLSMTKAEGVEGRFPAQLVHMKLDNGEHKDSNEFVNAKKQKFTLAPFKPMKSTIGQNLCPWVDETIKALAEKNRVPEDKLDQVLFGKGLAEAWLALEDAILKQAALVDIKKHWQAKGMWESPQGKSTKHAKAIYEAGA